MTQRHKHADVIIAWANGAEVECRGQPSRGWLTATNPGWNEEYEYRVKPLAKKYRVALFKDPGYYTSTVDTQEDAVCYTGSSYFVRWLTDWVEYEET